MTTDDFWPSLREVRERLVEAGEDTWSQAVRVAAAPLSRRAEVPEALVRCLEDLRDQSVAGRLGLDATLDDLLVILRRAQDDVGVRVDETTEPAVGQS